ncbi:MAG: TMEM143 family protein [Xanthobacteraceae bacterium]
MTAAGGDSGNGRASEERDQFIPVRKTDILDKLVEHGPFADEAQRSNFRQICRMLAAVYHYEYFDKLEHLRHAYYYFNPEIDADGRFDAATVEAAYAELNVAFLAVLKGANFVEVPHDEIEQAHRARAEMRVEVKAPIEDFREVRFFRRGHHQERFDVARWFGYGRKQVDALVYDDIVLFVAMKTVPEAEPRRRRTAQRKVRPGAVLIKYFRNIASADLNALFPNVRVVMSTFDKVVLAVPALAGGIPILLNLASTVTVLFLVIGFYLGISAAVQEDQMKGAFAAMSGLVALGGFIMRQWVKYQRQSLKYQQELTDNIYFRNVNNNAGIFDHIIGAAEEQECKEAFLAYYFLHTAPAPMSQADLDRSIEGWLKDKFKLDIDFEVEDALGKLERLRLLVRDGDRLSVLSPERALARIDEVWDNYFQFNAAAKEAAAQA